MEEEIFYPPESDLDLSFTSCASTTTVDRTLSGRSSLARSSLCLSFNESGLSSTSAAIPNHHPRPHRESDPLWAAIKTASNLSSDGTLHLPHLKLLRQLGSGNLGRVFLCSLRDNDHANVSFALKVVDRDSLTTQKLSHVETEANILSILDHPFLPTLYAHIDVSHYTCLLIDYCPNGDLHSLLSKQPGNRLPLQPVKFFAAEVLLALEYLHALGIIYRDLKPENILIREDGHIMLSDFDLCFKGDVKPKLQSRIRHSKPQRFFNCFKTERQSPEEVVMVMTEFVAEPTSAFSKSRVGTHEYLAPELVEGKGHGNGVDWWAFGILLHELLYGRTPFKGGSKEATLHNISSTKNVKFQVVEEEEEKGMAEARDLIKRLLVKDPGVRLGCAGGATDIKRHPFFDGIKWPLIRTYRAPEVRGVVANKSKMNVSRHVSEVTSLQSRHYWWRELSNFMRIRGSKHKLNSNNNSYCYTKGRKFA